MVAQSSFMARLAVAALSVPLLAGMGGIGASPAAAQSNFVVGPSTSLPRAAPPVARPPVVRPPGDGRVPVNPRPGGGGRGMGAGIATGVGIGIGTAIIMDAIGRANAAPREVVIDTDEPPPRQARRSPPSDGGPPRQQARNSGPQRPAGSIVIPPQNENRFVPDEVLVEFRSGLRPAAVEAVLRRNRLTRISTETFALTGTTVERLRLPRGANVRNVLRALSSVADVARAQPNYVFALVQTAPAGAAATSAHMQDMQYALQKLQLGPAHQLARGAAVRIAVIDSGIDTGHPELAGAVVESRDAVGGEARPHTHGTAMAGAITARSNLLGVAPGANLIAVRAFGGAGGGRSGSEGTTIHVMRALDLAHGSGARIVNMSFAGPRDAALSRALAAAAEKGMILVAASGNAGARAAPMFPAADPNVIAVTATDAEDRIFAEAVRGAHVAVAAPGVDVLVPTPGGQYDFTSGTSVAAAHVSGVIALMLERDASLDVARVRAVLRESAQDLGARGPDPVFGAGLVDANGALARIAPRQQASSPAPKQ